jgi:3'-phosphoadenosine 5'-phosphosulfate sulfotransferase
MPLVVLAHGDYVNLLGGNIDTINQNTETLIDDRKEVQKSKYVHLLSRHQNAGQNRDIRIANSSFESATVEILETTVTNRNLILEEIQKRLNSGNACYRLVRNLLPSRLLSKHTLEYTRL